MPGENRVTLEHFIIKCFLAWRGRTTRFKAQNASTPMIPHGEATQSMMAFF
jgi:hypothetical protein